jgi:O-antigen/teichoic acid export membrane protein
MGIIQRQSISGFIFTFIGILLGFLIRGILMPYIFQPEEIGLLSVLISYGTILSTFAVLGFGAVSVKMFPYFRDSRSKHHGFFGLSVFVGILGVIIASLIYFSLHDLIVERGAEKSSMFAKFFYLIIPLTFFLMLYTVIDTYFRVLYQTVIGIVYKEIIQRIMILIVFSLFYLELINFTLNVYFYLIAFSLPTVFLLIEIIRKKEYSLIPDFKFLRKPLLKKIGHVSLFGFFNSFSGILVINIDVLMLNHLQGLSQTGIYSIAFFCGTLVLIPSLCYYFRCL